MAEEPGRALTWMDAVVDGIPITPRMGKPVELSALWCHSLRVLAERASDDAEGGRLRRIAEPHRWVLWCILLRLARWVWLTGCVPREGGGWDHADSTQHGFGLPPLRAATGPIAAGSGLLISVGPIF